MQADASKSGDCRGAGEVKGICLNPHGDMAALTRGPSALSAAAVQTSKAQLPETWTQGGVPQHIRRSSSRGRDE